MVIDLYMFLLGGVLVFLVMCIWVLSHEITEGIIQTQDELRRERVRENVGISRWEAQHEANRLLRMERCRHRRRL